MQELQEGAASKSNISCSHHKAATHMCQKTHGSSLSWSQAPPSGVGVQNFPVVNSARPSSCVLWKCPEATPNV